jgi:hypothetical protein
VVAFVVTYQKGERLYTPETYFEPKATMTRHALYGGDASARKPPTVTSSISIGALFLLGTLALLVAVSYPLYAIATVSALVAGAAILRIGVPALARELHGRVTELEVPGIGTVQIRVSGR